MDSYTEDVHLQSKGFVTDLSTNELTSLEQGTEEPPPHYEHLEVQLRFELGSPVDTNVLIDTNGPRESHWDFVRQEQGRFQASPEENSVLLSHDKQDESFNNCENWPRSVSREDTRMFIDAQDDVRMITEAFTGKEKSLDDDDVVEDGRGLLVQSVDLQRKEEIALIGEDKQVLKEKVSHCFREGDVEGTIEVSHISTSKSDVSVDDKRLTEYGGSQQTPMGVHRENHQAGCPAADVNKELHLSAEQIHAADVAHAQRTISKPSRIVEVVLSKDGNWDQEVPLERNERCVMETCRDLVETAQSDLSNVDDLAKPGKTGRVDLIEKIELQSENMGLLPACEGTLEMDIVNSKSRAEARINEKMFPTLDIACTVGNEKLAQRTELSDASKGFRSEVVSQPLSLTEEINVVMDVNKSFVITEGSRLDDMPECPSLEPGVVLADAAEKQNASKMEFSGGSSKPQETQTQCTSIVPVPGSCQERIVLSTVEASSTNENAGGENIATHAVTVAPNENNTAGEAIAVRQQTDSALSALQPPHNSISAVTLTATVAVGEDEACPAAQTFERPDPYESGIERLGNNNSAIGLEKAELTQDNSLASNLNLAESCPSHRGELLTSNTLHVSDGHGEEGAADNRASHEHAVETVLESQHASKSTSYLSNMESPSEKSLDKQFEANDIQDDFREGTLQGHRTESVPLEKKIEQHTTDKDAMDQSLYSAEGCQSNENKVATDASLPGGVLHVLLDVHKEGMSDNCPPKRSLHQRHITAVEGEGLADTQVLNSSVTTGQEYGIGSPKVAAVCSDSYVSGPIAQVAQEDVNSTFEISGKRKVDLSIRNSRLKNSARASPIRARNDEEERNGGSEDPGRCKATLKPMSQKKGMDSIESFTSPTKQGSKGSSGRKKAVSPMVQDAGKEVCQMPASTSKSVFAGNMRHHIPPDVNPLEIGVAISSQTFSEPQQVQLRAQILVYGSLIQGAAPEEALMVAAFSNVGGGLIGRESELSERMVWEKQWQAAVDRIHSKSLRDSFTPRTNSALVLNSPVATTKAAEGSVKPNGNSGVTNNVVDYNRQAGPLARPLDVSGIKGQASRPRQSTDSAHDVSVSGRQAIVTATPLGSVTSAASRAASSTLNESFPQPPKPRTDFQQVAPQTYFPAPSLGPFMTGAPQWFSASAFPGSWMPQNQSTAYAKPSLFSHAQAIPSSDQTSEIRRSTTSPSGTVMLSNSLGTTLFTPVVGSMPVTPATADPLLTKQNASESRPRKRKKTQSESFGPSTDASLTHATGSSPVGGVLAPPPQSQLQTGEACLGLSNSAHLPLSTSSEALAIVVASTQLARSCQETSLVAVPDKKVLVPCSASMPSGVLPPVKNLCDKLIDLQSSADHLLQAQASAEEAACAAASALRESESVWNQLKERRSSGSIPDVESQLVSSAVAVATAASVAKAAAAAAKAAYEAAAQAKRISEGVLGVGNQVTESPRLLGDKDTSQAWGMPENLNSILTAAKMAAKQRFEAVSLARSKAENFESVVRAAELAANAITQVGSVMALGESVPFTLDMLLEAGPEGLLRLEEKTKIKTKGTALRSPRTAGTPKSSDREKKFPFKISGSNDITGQRDAQMDSWTPDSIMVARPDNETRKNTELGVGSVTADFQKTTDHLNLSTPASKQGLLTTRTESGLMEQGVFANDKIGKGSLVEVMSDEKGLRGVWFSARVQSLDEEKVFVLYDDLLADDGYSPLEEWIQLKESSGKAPRVRLAHPYTHIGFEGTRKRRREAMGSQKWSVGDCVDAWIRDGWWEGEIKEIIEDGENKAKIFFPGDGDTSIVKTSKLRPSLVWNNGHWALWSDAKKESSRAKIDSHEVETPFAKRQKTERSQASSMKEKLMPGSSMNISAVHMEPSLFDSNAVNLATDFKGLGADSIANPRLQTSKVVFGVPRPTKKRKLIEVSKHFGSAMRVPGASAFEVKASNNKTETSMVFATGPSDTGRMDASKAKKRILHQPKGQPQKDLNIHVTASGKKEKIVSSSKTILRRNILNKHGLPMLSKNKESNPMKKKNVLSESNQLEPRERSVGRALPLKVEKQTPSIPHTDNDKESSLAPHDDEKSDDVDHESKREPYQGAHATDVNRTSTNRASKEKAKQLAQHAKDVCMKFLAPTSGKEAAAQSSKKKESLASKDNEGTVRKGTESQPNHEDDKKLEPSGKKQSANLVNNDEKQYVLSTKESEKNKEQGKPISETWEPRRTSRKIQPTSKLLEGLQTAPKLGKTGSSHDRSHKGTSKAIPQA